jgi:hypothetical protein
LDRNVNLATFKINISLGRYRELPLALSKRSTTDLARILDSFITSSAKVTSFISDPTHSCCLQRFPANVKR